MSSFIALPDYTVVRFSFFVFRYWLMMVVWAARRQACFSRNRLYFAFSDVINFIFTSMLIKLIRPCILLAICLSGTTMAMDYGSVQSGLVITEDMPNNRDRSVRPDQLLNPDEQAREAPGILDFLREDMMVLYSSGQSARSRSLRALFSIPVCIPFLLCFYGCYHALMTSLHRLMSTFSRDDEFAAFLSTFTSDNNLQISQLYNRDIINIWLSWIQGQSDSIIIHSAENADGEQSIIVNASQDLDGNSLNVDTSAIRHQIVSFRDAQSIFNHQHFGAMISIINPYQLNTPIIIYQRENSDYIQVLHLSDLSYFSVTTENFVETIHSEIEIYRQTTEANPPNSTIEHFLVDIDSYEPLEVIDL